MTQLGLMPFDQGMGRLKRAQTDHFNDTKEYLKSSEKVILTLRKFTRGDVKVERQMSTLSIKIKFLFDDYAELMKDLRSFGACQEVGGMFNLVEGVDYIILDIRDINEQLNFVCRQSLKVESFPSQLVTVVGEVMARSSSMMKDLTENISVLKSAYAAFDQGMVMIKGHGPLPCSSKRRHKEI